MADTRRRVKLYALNAERQWDDRGTGHVSSLYVEKLKGMSLLVRAESDNSILLESRIHPDTVYQKQQETLIVWSEADNFDLALSFQEKAGCDEIWEKICQVQGSDPSLEVTQDIAEESEDERLEETRGPSPPLELPPCEISRLPEINDFIREFSNTPENKDKLALSIDNESYIRKLLQVFHECETYENLDGLRNLYHIFKNIFLLNKNDLFEIMFSDDLIFDVIGCLEYDPLHTVPKKHRNYLKNNVKFKEALPIQNQELLMKIHQTFRVQYIHDVVILAPSVFEENLFPTLSSFVFFNKVEIVTMVQEDDRFLTELFASLTDESTGERKRRDLILFLKELFNYSQHLQAQPKDNFCKTLTNFGILTALEITLCCPDPQTKAATIDILSYIIDFSPSVVRDYALQQASNVDDDQMLMNIILEQMICDTDPEMGGAVQLVGSLRTLLDPENMLASINKSEKSDFLNLFYKHSFQILIEPLLENTINFEIIKDDFQTVQLLSLILELLSFCIEHHTYHIKNCILGKEVLRRILVLLKSSHKFLALCALRFLRKLITLKDEFYNRHIIKGNLFAPIVEVLVENKSRYNLLESAVLDLFEYIKIEEIKSLFVYVVESFGKVLDRFDYVQTFKGLRVRYDQYQEKLKDRDIKSIDAVPSIMKTVRFRRDHRQLDEEEEMWFDEEDEFENNDQILTTTDEILGKKFESDIEPINKLSGSNTRTLAAEGNGLKFNSLSPSSKAVLSNSSNLILQSAILNDNTKKSASPSVFLKKSLVDYEGDSDEEDDDSELSERSSPKKPRLS